MSENWLPITGHEGFYEVSDYGRVRSLDREFVRADGRRQPRRGRILTPTPSGKGYPSVTLRHGERRAVHVLVCTAFIGPRPDADHEVAHFNGRATDNCVRNLRWATRSENQQDSIRHGTKFVHPGGAHTGDRNPNARLSEDQVEEMRRTWDAGAITQTQLAIDYGVSTSQAHNIVRRKQRTTRESGNHDHERDDSNACDRRDAPASR